MNLPELILKNWICTGTDASSWCSSEWETCGQIKKRNVQLLCLLHLSSFKLKLPRYFIHYDMTINGTARFGYLSYKHNCYFTFFVRLEVSSTNWVRTIALWCFTAGSKVNNQKLKSNRKCKTLLTNQNLCWFQFYSFWILA